MSFANGRNFGAPLRLIGSGMVTGGLLIADRESLPAISWPHESIGGDDQSPHTSKDSSVDESISGQTLQLLCFLAYPPETA